MSQNDRDSETNNEGFYPIRHVCSETGINPVTLRAWERRYNLVSPTRTPKGHRLYSDADIEQIREILSLLEEGIPISQVPRALETRCRTRAADPTSRAKGAAGNVETISNTRSWSAALEAGDERFILEELRGDPAAQQLLLALTLPEPRAFVDRCKMLEIGLDWDYLYGRSVALLYNVLRADARRNSSSEVALALLTSQLELRLSQHLADWRDLHEHPRLLFVNPGSGHRRIPGLLLATACARRGAHVTLIGDVVNAASLQALITRGRTQALVFSVSTQVIRSPQNALLDEMLRNASVPMFLGGTEAHSLERTHAAVGSDTNIQASNRITRLPSDTLQAAERILAQTTASDRARSVSGMPLAHRKHDTDQNGFSRLHKNSTPKI